MAIFAHRGLLWLRRYAQQWQIPELLGHRHWWAKFNILAQKKHVMEGILISRGVFETSTFFHALPFSCCYALPCVCFCCPLSVSVDTVFSSLMNLPKSCVYSWNNATTIWKENSTHMNIPQSITTSTPVHTRTTLYTRENIFRNEKWCLLNNYILLLPKQSFFCIVCNFTIVWTPLNSKAWHAMILIL